MIDILTKPVDVSSAHRLLDITRFGERSVSSAKSTPRGCSFPGCQEKHRGRGLCNGHLLQQQRGKPLIPLFLTRRRNGSPPRIKYVEAPCPRADLKGPCHIFCGGARDGGYGKVSWQGKAIRVHCYVWLQAGRKLHKGKMIDHQCRVRRCCNIDHLREVSPTVNALENNDSGPALNARKTHCLRGHPFNAANTYRPARGGRMCRECIRQRSSRRAAALKRARKRLTRTSA